MKLKGFRGHRLSPPLPDGDAARKLRDAGAVAVSLRWHAVQAALGPDAAAPDWAALADWARGLS